MTSSSSASLIMSSLALVVALSGTSYAITVLDDNSVTTPKIFDAAVTSPKIAANAVTTDKINITAVSRAKIQLGAVASAQIADGGVGTADLAANAVDGTKIRNGSITAADLLANSIADITTKSPLPGAQAIVMKSTDDRWTEVGSILLAPGSHLVQIRYTPLIEQGDSEPQLFLDTNLTCVLGNAMPGLAGAVSYAEEKLFADSVSPRSLWAAVPGSPTARTTVKMYCKMYAAPGQTVKQTAVLDVNWLALHVTSVHAELP